MAKTVIDSKWFVDQKENQVNIVELHTHSGKTKAGKPWFKNITHKRLIVKITPSKNDLFVPTVNLFVQKNYTGAGKKLSLTNVTNIPRRFDELLANAPLEIREKTVSAILKIFSEHSIETTLDVENFSPGLFEATYPFLYKNTLYKVATNYHKPQIFYPGVYSFYTQMGRYRNNEAFIEDLNLTYRPLIETLKTYEIFTPETVFFLTALAGSGREELLDKVLRKLSVGCLNDDILTLRAKPQQFKGLLSKVSDEKILELLTNNEIVVKDLEKGAFFWSPHYRELRKSEVSLNSLTSDAVISYVKDNVYLYKEVKKSPVAAEPKITKGFSSSYDSYVEYKNMRWFRVTTKTEEMPEFYTTLNNLENFPVLMKKLSKFIVRKPVQLSYSGVTSVADVITDVQGFFKELETWVDKQVIKAKNKEKAEESLYRLMYRYLNNNSGGQKVNQKTIRTFFFCLDLGYTYEQTLKLIENKKFALIVEDITANKIVYPKEVIENLSQSSGMKSISGL